MVPARNSYAYGVTCWKRRDGSPAEAVPKRCADAVVKVVECTPFPPSLCPSCIADSWGPMSAAESKSHAGLAEAERILWGHM